jgi:hypothetical protein
MTGVAAPTADVSPPVVAAVLLLARALSKPLGLPCPPEAQILKATQAGRSRAYELRGQLAELLPTLQRPPGRPASLPAEPAPAGATEAVTQAALEYVMAHPGCVHGGPTRRRYTDDYRRFIIELRQQHAELGLEHFAAAVRVPPGTLSDWLTAPKIPSTPEHTESEPASPDAELAPLLPQLESILLAYRDWDGTFLGFRDHVRSHLHICIGTTQLSNLLDVAGVRRRHRRSGRSPDEVASRGAFQTFIPDAQWVGDGSAIWVVFEDQRFDFNFEHIADCYSDGSIGMAVTDTEDSEALVSAFRDAEQTTETNPIALLLDNRGSNHTEQVDAVLGHTLRMRSTPGRGQSKAHVEGGFGLMKQALPPIVLPAGPPREQARHLAQLVLQAFLRGLNHRPRRDRGGRSRADLHLDRYTPEQIEQARAELEQRYRKQQLAQQTLAARQNPQTQRYLDETFHRLKLTDPEGSVRRAIARYPLSAIVDAVAIFEPKLRDGRIQPDEPARYLLGIVRSIAEENDEFEIAEQLIDARLLARDALLTPLCTVRDAILQAQLPTDQAARQLLIRALETDLRLDRLFWLRETALVIASAPRSQQPDLLHEAALRIHATHRIPHRERLNAFRYLADRAVPLS